MHRFRNKFPNFSGALGFRHILYIFPTRYREIKCFKNKQACSTPLKSNSQALNWKVKAWGPQRTLGPKPRGLASKEVHPQAEVMAPGGAPQHSPASAPRYVLAYWEKLEQTYCDRWCRGLLNTIYHLLSEDNIGRRADPHWGFHLCPPRDVGTGYWI